MAKFGSQPIFIAIVRQFHDDMHARFQNYGEFSGPFHFRWVKQSCVMAPTLSRMIFSAIFIDVFHDCDTGFSIWYRFDGKLFKSQT